MQRDGAVALTSNEVQQQRRFRTVDDQELIAAVLEHPGTSASTLARLLHVPGSAVDWWALKGQLHRLAAAGTLQQVRNGNHRKWIGWEVVR